MKKILLTLFVISQIFLFTEIFIGLSKLIDMIDETQKRVLILEHLHHEKNYNQIKCDQHVS